LHTPNAIRRSLPWTTSVEGQVEEAVRSARSWIDPDFFVGLIIAAVAPSLIWPLIVKSIGALVGYSFSWTSMAMLGSLIFCFLAVVYTVIARLR
jgi:hypothetical protein